MFRYSKKYQEIADRFAIESNYEASYFIGTYHEYGVFGHMHLDSRVRFSGAPSYILIDVEGNVQWVCNFQDTFMGSFDIMKNTKKWHTTLKGKKVYDKMMQKLETGNFSQTEYAYLQYLKSLDLYNWDEEKYRYLSQETMFIWLEVANRLNEEIAIFKRTEEFVNGIEISFFVAFRDRFLQYSKMIEEKWNFLPDWEIVTFPSEE